MKGKDILKKIYKEDELKMKKHLLYVKSEIEALKKTIVKFRKKIDHFKNELIELEEMTLTEWSKKHPKK